MKIKPATYQNKSSTEIVKSYSSGLEVLRVLAAYGVVFIHGISSITRSPLSLLTVQIFSSFCVPLFLVLSFYLTLKSLTKKPVSNKRFLADRFKRIGLPFLS
jgi:peptidoglycan/LPS O-acetylase OafA/YrhL